MRLLSKIWLCAFRRHFSGTSAARGLGRNDPEDLLQDCWIRIHRSRHTYRASEPVMPWIYAIARHTRLDAYRKQRRLQSREVLVASIPERLHQVVPESLSEEDHFDGWSPACLMLSARLS